MLCPDISLLYPQGPVASRGPPGEVIQHLPIQLPKKRKWSIDANHLMEEEEKEEEAEAGLGRWVLVTKDMEEVFGSLHTIKQETEQLQHCEYTCDIYACTWQDLQLCWSGFPDCRSH
ncbi:hypothetical protein Y1Q_0018210 [Alligator mississippiensis]|uniref:Uncharacterized protein n=1 Tax=Alligator mississippiensis TaxID=8496 RepID=A0A151M3Y9_ALLMI|nr:hypothetical protein Y1Q_0018210 [Alligator mississippiensis]